MITHKLQGPHHFDLMCLEDQTKETFIDYYAMEGENKSSPFSQDEEGHWKRARRRTLRI
ncbi:Hypothetical protein FKW44_013216 [Caligus rogercresseyi]|uniref:Uncharacterized protein n=1 Tax=Caligus rogercresseyi TaxID=217165 RepID=A0A7T8HKV5_CALRO|nr:Hypothetical protein FKW44_013216 [Caligus rogercresseyi]